MFCLDDLHERELDRLGPLGRRKEGDVRGEELRGRSSHLIANLNWMVGWFVRCRKWR